MASIKTRVAGLEQASRATVRRQLTDAERAVRVTHILNNPDRRFNARCVMCPPAFNAGGNRPQDLKSTTALIRT
jgi:hypothetical protein